MFLDLDKVLSGALPLPLPWSTQAQVGFCHQPKPGAHLHVRGVMCWYRASNLDNINITNELLWDSVTLGPPLPYALLVSSHYIVVLSRLPKSLGPRFKINQSSLRSTRQGGESCNGEEGVAPIFSSTYT